jgi:hypothetical protein
MNDDEKEAAKPEEEDAEMRALEEEGKRIAGLSRAELDAELAVLGHDPSKLRAKGAALAARLLKESALAPAWEMHSAPVPPRPRRRNATLQTVVTISMGLAASVVVALGVKDLAKKHTGANRVEVVQDGGTRKAEPSARDRAARLRERAFEACAKHLPDECEADLDAAMALDPSGESDPRTIDARDFIKEARTPHVGDGKM